MSQSKVQTYSFALAVFFSLLFVNSALASVKATEVDNLVDHELLRGSETFNQESIDVTPHFLEKDLLLATKRSLDYLYQSGILAEKARRAKFQKIKPDFRATLESLGFSPQTVAEINKVIKTMVRKYPDQIPNFGDPQIVEGILVELGYAGTPRMEAGETDSAGKAAILAIRNEQNAQLEKIQESVKEAALDYQTATLEGSRPAPQTT